MSTPVGFSVKTAYQFSFRNIDETLKAEVCSCYYCLHKFPPADITKWCDSRGETSVCPRCDIDAVLPFDVATDILQECQSEWFGEAVGCLTAEDEDRVSGVYPVLKEV